MTNAQRPEHAENRPAGGSPSALTSASGSAPSSTSAGGSSTGRSRVGAVTLIVRDLERMAAFYRDMVGLWPIVRAGDESSIATLGIDDQPLLILEGRPDAPLAPSRSTGLYHVAYLLPTRADLARQLMHFAKLRVPLQGLSDHGVSEAIYLADPEGNGIEIYADRPREAWPYDSNGTLRMTTDPLDVENLLAEPGANEPFNGVPRGTIVGHMHLRVSDLAAAEHFYRETLGMNVTTRYGNAASFLSYDGYHHHLGLNTWSSLNAPPPQTGAAGLAHYVVRPPASIERGELFDPSGNRIVIDGSVGAGASPDAS